MCSVCLWRRGDRRGKGEEWRGGASPSPHPHWKDYFKQIEMFWTYHFKQISKCTATLPPGLRTDPYLTNIFTCYLCGTKSEIYEHLLYLHPHDQMIASVGQMLSIYSQPISKYNITRKLFSFSWFLHWIEQKIVVAIVVYGTGRQGEWRNGLRWLSLALSLPPSKTFLGSLPHMNKLCRLSRNSQLGLSSRTIFKVWQ